MPSSRLARLLANLPLLADGAPPLLVPLRERRTYLMLLGDYTRARGQPQPGEDLVRAGPEREALADFFRTCWASSLDLVANFQARQQDRDQRGERRRLDGPLAKDSRVTTAYMISHTLVRTKGALI